MAQAQQRAATVASWRRCGPAVSCAAPRPRCRRPGRTLEGWACGSAGDVRVRLAVSSSWGAGPCGELAKDERSSGDARPARKPWPGDARPARPPCRDGALDPESMRSGARARARATRQRASLVWVSCQLHPGFGRAREECIARGKRRHRLYRQIPARRVTPIGPAMMLSSKNVRSKPDSL